MPTQAEIEAAWKIAGLDVSRETIREILEAAERARWQPIDTAPRDGTWILVWGRWVEGTGKPMAPTHWQPLPSPPESK